MVLKFYSISFYTFIQKETKYIILQINVMIYICERGLTKKIFFFVILSGLIASVKPPTDLDTIVNIYISEYLFSFPNN